MKIFTVLATIGIIAAPAFATVQMNNEFIQGFESGIQLGDGSDISEYGCPQPHLAGPLGNINQVLAPLKMMGGLVQDKNLETLLTTVDVFVNSISSLMAVFSNYEGDDFCSGIIFGQKGSHMLVNIAKTLVSLKKMQPTGAQGAIRAKPAAPSNDSNQHEAPKAGPTRGGNTNSKPNFRRWNGN